MLIVAVFRAFKNPDKSLGILSRDLEDGND